MKRSVLLGSALVSMLLLSGCGNSTKTLSCSLEQSENGFSAKQTIEAKFVGNEVKNVGLDMTMTLDDELKDNKDLLISSLEEEFEEYQNKEGLDFNINSTSDTEIKLTLNADLEKMSDEDKEELDLVDTTGDYEATKKELEDEGYTCK